MTPIRNNADARTSKEAAREARARDAALARQEYEAEKLAILDKTARLRALRLEREAADALQPKQKPIKRAG